ncbi:MAG TPA: dUTP diphosphatase [Flavisolibacter sp.]|jgi:dUTP pyrophosphatase|nr:dUTP diphosphatase [Flavisolibacter sp.]
MIIVKIVNKSSNPDPSYATSGSAGMDLRANLEEDLILQPLERKLIPTGLFIQLPDGFEGQVRPRSGLAIRHGITCLNSPGTIDADYRGEIKIILINLSNQTQIVKKGERIAQLVIQKVEQVIWEKVEVIMETERNERGFGSTGKN